MLAGAWGATRCVGAPGAVRCHGCSRRDLRTARHLSHLTHPSHLAHLSYRPLIPLGQFRDTFIIAIDDEGICIIDQHVAHERVLFERIMERLTAGALESQRLLVPMLLDLAPAERDALLARDRGARASRVRDRGVWRRHR